MFIDAKRTAGRQPSLETASPEDSHLGPRSHSFLEQLGSNDQGYKAPVSLTTIWDKSEEPRQLQSCIWDCRKSIKVWLLHEDRVSFFDMARSPRSLSSKHTALFPSQCSFRETLLEATVHKRPILSGLCPELRWSHLRKYTWLHIKVNEYSKTLQNKRASSYN